MISIHALREESDAFEDADGGRIDISIHALREESDMRTNKLDSRYLDFNPRSP